MLKGISHLSVDFGDLSEENLQLKEELKEAQLENRRLQLKLSSTVTNYAELPLLMDNETQTEGQYQSLQEEEDFCGRRQSSTGYRRGIPR